MIVDDRRTGVWLVRRDGKLLCLWSSVYLVDKNLQPDEREMRHRKIRIHRAARCAPILVPRRLSPFLTGMTLRRFELETGLKVTPFELRDLDSRSEGAFDRKWAALNAVERLRILEWIAEG
jgi:hypothetical protein